MDQLKDVILSTLAEIQETPIEQEEKQPTPQMQQSSSKESVKKVEAEQIPQTSTTPTNTVKNIDEELLFLESLRERFLVLFEGFQAPNNVALEAKIDLTLNFMEYVLSSLDTRIEQIKGK